jgi:hypothetical protein
MYLPLPGCGRFPTAAVVALEAKWPRPSTPSLEAGSSVWKFTSRALPCRGEITFSPGDIKNIQLPDSQQTVARWFNTDAGFNKNSSQQLANNIRTFPIRFSGIRADSATGWNFSMSRNYCIRERLQMQFQAEAFNALNHPVFAAPNATPTSSAFGTVTNSAFEPRSIDFSLKIVF